LIVVGEKVTNKEVEIWDQSRTDGSHLNPNLNFQQRFGLLYMEVCAEPTAEPTKLNQRAPIKMVSGRAWSPVIYQALRLLGKTLDAAWERVFIHPLTFN
jgi:hypothetical protein